MTAHSASPDLLREAVLFGPEGVTFPHLPHHPTGPDVLEAVAYWMDKVDARDGNPNNAVQIYLMEWARRLRAALQASPAPPQGTRLALVADDLLASWGSRTLQGQRISAEWGEPDERGWYTPTFTVHYDDTLAPAPLDADRLARAWDAVGPDRFVAPEQWAAVLAEYARLQSIEEPRQK